jgi:protein-S-isoprenylcysteine O-methyltransferase Ste14
MANQPAGSGPGGGRGASRLIIVRWILDQTMRTVGQGAVLFVSAGRIDWAAGWAYVLLTLAWVAGTGAVLIPWNPDLLAERLRPRKGAKTWDVLIMSLVGVVLIALYVVGGLDERHGWSVGIAPAGQIAAGVVMGLGYALVVWATAANRFFSLIVRIQVERGHVVATGGPYRWVRHPAYVGGILGYLAGPILLGSWWALVPGILCTFLMVLRTALEDRTLQAELAGYREYAGRVRYRLLPGVW